MKTTSVLGVPVSVANKDQLLNHIADCVQKKEITTIVAINARKIVRILHDPCFQKQIMRFHVFLADGASVAKATDYQVERIAGIDLMEEICRNGSKIGARIFFYGAEEESNLAAQKMLSEKYPDMYIAGYCNGYTCDDIAEKIRNAKANVVFVAKGTPAQELWIQENAAKTGANVFLGVGGAFDIFGGQVSRAPKVLQRMGIEWLYRMLCEPKRLKQIPELFEFWWRVKTVKRHKQ